MSTAVIKGFVWTGDELGLGRVISMDKSVARVQYMHSLSRLRSGT